MKVLAVLCAVIAVASAYELSDIVSARIEVHSLRLLTTCYFVTVLFVLTTNGMFNNYRLVEDAR